MNKIDFSQIKTLNNDANKQINNYPGAAEFFSLNNIKKLEEPVSNTFNYRIKGDLNVLNQARSGRCWLFATLSMLRIKLIKKYKLNPNFKLSVNYLNFWSLLEKSNTFLYYIHKTKDKPLINRELEFIFDEAIYEGGNWNFSSQLITKYGIIPASLMPETSASKNSNKLLKILNMKLGSFAQEIRSNNALPIKSYLQQIYEILILFLGKPPLPYEKFLWDYENNESSDNENKSKIKENDESDSDEDSNNNGNIKHNKEINIIKKSNKTHKINKNNTHKNTSKNDTNNAIIQIT